MNKLPKFYKPECAEPLLIVNRRALYLMTLQDAKVKGVPRSFSPFKKDYIKKLLKQGYHLTDGDKQGCYVQVGCQIELVYRYVPCGSCSVCRHSKRNEFITRCTLEQQLYNCPPYTFRLTYDDAHLPANGEICYRDVQLFFKRFRKRLSKLGMPTDYRYAVACEYGHKRGRPHYHVLMFNNPFRCSELEPIKHNLLKRMIWEAWQNDYWSVFSDPQNFGQCYGGIASYIAKYMAKGSRWDDMHVNKSRVYMSTHSGGLGVPYLDKFKGYYSSLEDCDHFDYLDMTSGQVRSCAISSFIKRRYWPSPLASVPHKVRAAYRDLVECVKRSYAVGWMTEHEAQDFLEKLRPDHVPLDVDWSLIDRIEMADYGAWPTLMDIQGTIVDLRDMLEWHVRDKIGKVMIDCMDVLRDYTSSFDLEHYYQYILNQRVMSNGDKLASDLYKSSKEDAILLNKTSF